MIKNLKVLAVAILAQASSTAIAQCGNPTNLTTSYDINTHVTTFSWTPVPGATSYNIGVRIYSPNAWPISNGTSVLTNSYSITGLVQSFTFNWRVRANCSGNLGTYTNGTNFTIPCGIALNPVVTGVAPTTATINWTTIGAALFYVSYRISNSNSAWTFIPGTNASSMVITGLQSNTAYDYKIVQSCNYSDGTPVYGSFTTQYVACDQPTNFNVYYTYATQVNMSWTNVNGGSSYSIDYKPASGSSWTTINNVTTPYFLTGLTPETLYDIRLKANCSGNLSTYVSTQFNTCSSICPAWGLPSTQYISLFGLGSINRPSGREINGYRNTGLSTNLTIGSSVNAGQFAAGYNPGILFGDNYAVYIDFNNNGTFTDAGENVVSPSYVSGLEVKTFNIAVPSNLTPRTVKLRVVMINSNSSCVPCSTGAQGEVEDYYVNLVSGSAKMASGNEATGITQIKEISDAVMVYPNPSSGKFNIELPVNIEVSSYEILNISGQVVAKAEFIQGMSPEIDMSDYANGLYLINLYTPNQEKIVTKKINLIK